MGFLAAYINTAIFPGTPSKEFWSSVPVANSATNRWYVSYGATGSSGCWGGTVTYIANTNNYSVRCVRCNDNTITDRFDNTTAAGIVKDKLTGLWWEKASTGSSQGYRTNLNAFCGNKNISNIVGWRPPTIKELSTIVNYTITPGNPVAYSAFIGDKNSYWSSTPVVGIPSNAWGLIFSSGYVDDGRDGFNMFDQLYVRCVCDSNCHFLPAPAANWSASTGIYNDATNQTNRFNVNNGVVTDTLTNLQWEQGYAAGMNWTAANSTCDTLTTGGYTDW
ncbi:MAG: DUF1566 domain-containing protein, partial [bacterium]